MTRKCLPRLGRLEQEFVFRVSHLERIVEVYNARLDRWETEVLQDLTETVSTRPPLRSFSSMPVEPDWTRFNFGWFQIRLPDNPGANPVGFGGG